MKRRLAHIVLAGLSVALLSVAGVLAFRNAAWWLDVGEPPVASDYVVVLPGDPDRRPFVAAALIKAGLARQALVPETVQGPDVLDGIALPSSEVILRVLRARGVPREKIKVLRGTSNSTSSDMALITAFLRRYPTATVTFVTSAFHTRRARWTIRRWLRTVPNFAGEVHFVAAPNPEFQTERWWRTEAGFLCVTSEYGKLIAYWLRYENGIGWLIAALVATIAFWVGKKRLALGQPGRASGSQELRPNTLGKAAESSAGRGL